ncbi:MAG: hypothetical protein L6R28_08650 [Planctomycetes bacterium]|nr:hypothetical protein [Planctomycetota bacterium]
MKPRKDLDRQLFRRLKDAGVAIESLDEISAKRKDWKIIEMCFWDFREDLMFKYPRDKDVERWGFNAVLAMPHPSDSPQEVRRSLVEENNIREALKKVGIRTRSIWDFVNGKDVPEGGIPVLLSALKRAKCPRNRNGLARSLTFSRRNDDLASDLISIYEKCPCRSQLERNAKEALAQAIAYAASEALFEELARLAADSSHGRCRRPFFEWLYKKRNKVASLRVLRRLRKDPDMGNWAKHYLRKAKAHSGR